MPQFERERFVEALRAGALPPFGKGVCARHVRLALEAAGLDMSRRPVHAREYGPTLQAHGFAEVAVPPDKALPGDIAVIEAAAAGESGHIQGFDGANWISDFVQRAFWPGPKYRTSKPLFVIYRHGGDGGSTP